MRYNIIGKNIDVWDKTKEMVEKRRWINCQAVPCGHRGNHHIKLGKTGCYGGSNHSYE